MDGRVRVALVGAGVMANRYHYTSLASFPDVDLVGIADLVPAKAEETARRFNIPAVYSDFRRMLDDTEPDAVYVLMPPQVLYEPAHDVLVRGMHLFVEKPLALTTSQARMLAYTAGQHDCLTMVGFQRRHVPAIAALRSRVEQAGPIHSVHVDFLKATADLSRPAGFYDGAIDAFTSDGIHAVDTLRWLCGGEVEDVRAVVRRLGVPGPVPNAIDAQVTFSTGAVGTLRYNLLSGRRIFRADFSGPNVSASVDPDRDSLIVAGDAEPEIISSSTFGQAAAGDAPLEDRHWLGFWHESRHFIDCVRAGVQPTSHFAGAVKTMELVERILQAGSSCPCL
jgi:predicted dehydrogenase